MAIDERARHALHSRLDEVLGADEATTLMSHLPPVGWADVATKRDLDQLSAELRAELHQEIGGLRAELHQEIGGLRAELHQEIGGLRADLHREIGGVRGEFSGQTRVIVFSMLASNATLAALAFAAARLA